MADPNAGDILNTVLNQGGNLAEAAQAIAAASEAPPAAPPAGEQAPPAAAPAEGEPQLSDTEKALIERERRKWESGATPKFEAAKRAEDLARSLKTNPRGTLLYLAEQYGVKLAPDEPRAPAAPRQPTPDPDQAEVAAIRSKFKEWGVPDEQFEAVDRLTTIKARQMTRESVRPVQEAIVSDLEERQLRDLEAQGVTNARELLPQVRKLQGDMAANPYLQPKEAINILEADRLRKENAELRARLARPPADDKARGTVGGGSATAPRAVSPHDKSAKEMEKDLLAAGFRAERE